MAQTEKQPSPAGLPAEACGARLGVRFKFALLIGAIVALLMLLDGAWNIGLQQRQSENEAREKAEVLADQMHAVWNFIDLNQANINRNEDGTFRSKTLVCVVAAKSISMLFTRETDYSIRFTSTTPRQVANTPDEFESRAFAAFAADPTLEAYYGVDTDAEGNSVFRYVEPLYVTQTCLECHGDPVGELDQYGYPKEGMQLGDIGGAMSITEPMDIYLQGMRTTVTQQLFMMLLVLVLALAGIYAAVSRIILKPLDSLGQAAKKIGEGRFDYSLGAVDTRHPDEITEFACDFDKMGRRLERLCMDLESEVRGQTEQLCLLNEELTVQKGELKNALERLQEERDYKDDFFAVMSHELRTPLTSILAFARILKEQSLDAKTREAVVEIEANATLLLRMVNNILTISKAEAHKDVLVREPVDFVDLLGFVRGSLEPLAANKNIALTARCQPDVPITMADWEKLRRILENLVDNAIKYTHVNGRVDVSARFDPEEPAAVVLRVSDDGMGIDPDELGSIFERYHQAGQSPNRRYRGTGLGLAVVKGLAEMHGGSVAVESQRKKGTVFTVRIPYVAVETEDDYDEDPAR